MLTTTTIVIIFVFLALADIAVIVFFRLKVKRIQKIFNNESSKTNLLTAMLEQTQKSTFDVNIFNTTPLEVIKEIRRTISQHYFICFNKLNATILGNHLLQIRTVVFS
jgi:hypothetical protein